MLRRDAVSFERSGVSKMKNKIFDTLLVFTAGVLLYCPSFMLSGCSRASQPDPYADSMMCVALAFQALEEWDNGDTNGFRMVVAKREFDGMLRKTVYSHVKTGRSIEVDKSLNKYIDMWIVMRTADMRAGKWPDENKDANAFQLLQKIAEYRLIHPHSIDDAEVNKVIVDALQRTLSEEKWHK